MKRYVVVENPKHAGSRHVPAMRPVTLPEGASSNNVRGRSEAMKVVPIYPGVSTALNRGKKKKKGSRNVITTALNRKGGKRSKGNVTTAFNAVTTALGAVTTALNRRSSVKRNTITTALNRRKSKRVASASSRSRGRTAKAKGGRKSMATTAKQRAYRAFFKSRRKAGQSAKQIGAAWRKGHKSTRRNKSGRPLSGARFRPSLPKGPESAVTTRASVSYRKSAAIRAKQAARSAAAKGQKSSKKKKKAKKNAFYTMYNRKKGRKGKGLSSSRARAMARKRWHGNRGHKKNFRRNVGLSGLLANFKSVASLKTVQEGLAVLAGAVVATGAPSLLPTWNVGWMGVGLSLLTAALGAAVASMFMPALAVPIAAGGVVVVGLRLVAQFAPRALRWSAPMAGFLEPYGGPGSVTGVGNLRGYLEPPPGARSVASPHRAMAGLGRLGRLGGGMRAGGESFKGAPLP